MNWGNSGVIRFRGRSIAALVVLALTTTLLQPFSATTATASINNYSLFADYLPAATPVFDAPTELGVSASTSVAGQVTAIRFYQYWDGSNGNKGAHTGYVWSGKRGDPSNIKLATKRFPTSTDTPTASGWVQVSLDTPISIGAGETFTVSVSNTNGFYTRDGKPSSKAVGPLTLLGTSYRYNSDGIFPHENSGTNYGIDFVFQPTVTCGLSGANSKTCEVGDTGPGGGKVFFVSQYPFPSPGSACDTAGIGGTSTCTVLQAAPAGWYDGNADPLRGWSDAKALASAYQGSDTSAGQWFLPTIAQLRLLYTNRSVIGTYDTYSPFGSSTENGGDYYYQYFSNGNVGSYGKGDPYNVRPIKAFADATISPITNYVAVSADEGNQIEISAPAGKLFGNVLFASYGTPEGYLQSWCHSPTSTSVIQALTGGQTLTVWADNGVFDDPCGGTYKKLQLVIAYTGAPATVPASPSFTAVTGGDRSLSLSVTAGSDGGSAITGYKYSLNGETFTVINSTTSPLVITGLIGRRNYSVRVKAVNAIGDSESTTALSATTTDVALDASEAAAESARLAALAEAARLAELAAEAARKAEIEERRLAEEAKKAEELKKLEEQKAEELKKLEAKKAEEKKAEELKKAEEKKAEELKKAEAKKLAEEKKAEELKKLEDQKKAEEEKAKLAAEAKAKADEGRREQEQVAATVGTAEVVSKAEAAAEIAGSGVAEAPVETIALKGKYLSSALSAGGNKVALRLTGLKIGTKIKIKLKRSVK